MDEKIRKLERDAAMGDDVARQRLERQAIGSPYDDLLGKWVYFSAISAAAENSIYSNFYGFVDDIKRHPTDYILILTEIAIGHEYVWQKYQNPVYILASNFLVMYEVNKSQLHLILLSKENRI